MKKIIAAVLLWFGLLTTNTVKADFLTFDWEASDFALTQTFSAVTFFEFAVEMDEPIVAGQAYSNPAIKSISYQVFGALEPGTPSGFPAFNLVRDMDGAEFYGQGSSMDFEIAADADFSDGLQVSEFAGSGTDVVFDFHAREFDTGRYHPPQFFLRADGTGRLWNSDNNGPNTENPATGELVDVEFGEEYITDLQFTPSSLTIGSVPEPSSMIALIGLGLAAGVFGLRRRRTLK